MKESQAARKDREGGWTFLETIIVMGIVLILTGSVGLLGLRYVEKAKRVAARASVETLVSAVQAYYFDCRQYPTREQGLQALWQCPVLSPVPTGWEGPYIDRPVAPDPWNSRYDYLLPGPNGLPFGVVSYGADTLPGGVGDGRDIASWQE